MFSDRSNADLMLDQPSVFHRQLRDMLVEVCAVLDEASVRYFLCAGTVLGAVREGDLIPWDFDVDLLIPIEVYDVAIAALRIGLPARYSVKDPGRDGDYEHLFGRVHLSGIHHKYAHVDLFPLGGTFSSRVGQRLHLKFSKFLRIMFYARARGSTAARKGGQSLRLRMALAGIRMMPRTAILWTFQRVIRLRSARRAAWLTNLTAGYLEREAMPRRMYDEEEFRSLAGEMYRCPAPADEYLRRVYGDYENPPPESEQRRFFQFFEEWYSPALRHLALSVRDDRPKGG